MRSFPWSAMKRFPEASKATPPGPYNHAEVAGPPSPANAGTPVPATVVMMPLADDTSRMRLLPVSAMKRFPATSTATLVGGDQRRRSRWPAVTGETSADGSRDAYGSDASDGRDDAAGRHLPDAIVSGVRDEEIPGSIHGDTPGLVQRRRSRRPAVAGEASACPLPHARRGPAAATVVMMPLADTFRIRLL